MVKIKLTKGYTARIDDADAPEVTKYNWCVGMRNNAPTAVRRTPKTAASSVKMQTLAEFLVGKIEGLEIGHKDGDSFNCQRANLRHGTRSLNWGNRRKDTKRYSSIYKGVHYSRERDRWIAQVRFESRQYWLGAHRAEDDAARAYNEKAAELFGEYARLNVIVSKRKRRAA